MLNIFKFKETPDLNKLTNVLREFHKEEERVNQGRAKDDFTFIYDSIIVKLNFNSMRQSSATSSLEGFSMSFLSNQPNSTASEEENAKALLFTISETPERRIPVMMDGKRVFSKIEEEKLLESIDFNRFLKFMENQILEIKNNKVEVVSEPVSSIAEKIKILRNADILTNQPEAVTKAAFRKN